MTTTGTTGFLLIDKETAWTSHDVVAKVRRYVDGKVGHAGTLDPMATGLLVLGIGRATRLLRYVQHFEKEYLATALFGVATDTLDADGAVLTREPMPVSFDDVDQAMERFRGDILQTPPMVSARKVDGRRLYELAREGKTVEREARPVTITRLELIDLAPSDYPEVTFRTVCSTGTYIRSLADDIASVLGGHAHLTALRRVRNGDLRVSDAVSVSDVAAMSGSGGVGQMILSPWDALASLTTLRVDDATAFRVMNGRDLSTDMTDAECGSAIRVGNRGGELIAVYRREEHALTPEVVLG